MEVVGLIIGVVGLFGQGYGAFKRYRRIYSKSSINARKHASTERALQKALKHAGPTVKLEYDKMFSQLGDILARHKDTEVHIEILTHQNTFLTNVLLTLQSAVSSRGGVRNPLDFAVLERYTTSAQTGILNSLQKAAERLSPPSRPQSPLKPPPPKIARIRILARCIRQFP